MSQVTAVRAPARHATRPAPLPQPPRLRVVAAPAHLRSRSGVATVCGVLLVAGLLALLLLQNSLAEGAYSLQAVQRDARELREEEQSLREQLERLQAPQNLAAKATALGMVPAPNPAFLRASDGKVLGVPAPGVASPSPTVSKPAATSSATPSAEAARTSKAGTAKSPAAPSVKPSARSTARSTAGEPSAGPTKKTSADH